MTTKISFVEIQHFRGIPRAINIDFVSGNPPKPASVIISGDNGTGKSSIVDAIEFALQGRIRRKLVSAYSFAIKAQPSVSIALADGTKITRGMLFRRDKWEITNNKPDERFSISPFVLTRADILRFIETPDIEKQMLFIDYFKGAISSRTVLSQTREDQKQRINEKLESSYIGKNQSIDKLALLLKIPVDEVPIDTEKFEEFVTERVYRGIKKRERDKLKKQGKLRIPHPIYVEVNKIRDFFKEISKLKRDIKVIEKESRRVDTSPIQSILSDASIRLTDTFKELSSGNFVEKIDLIFGRLSEVSLSIDVRLSNGKTCSPQQIFSEANLDLLALLVFTSILKEASKRGQSKLLILDDVFQSVDASIRVSVVDYLVKDFSDWQLIFTLHDRLWKSQLKEILRKNGNNFIEREIVRWSFQDGPAISTSQELEDLLNDAMFKGQHFGISSYSGLLLESICERLSWTLSTSVSRKKDDKYTLGDLWPGIAKTLKKTSISLEIEHVEKWIHLRNIAGAHFNEWALSLPLDDAKNFGNSILGLYNKTYCHRCYSWVEPLADGRHGYSCRCGTTGISPL